MIDPASHPAAIRAVARCAFRVAGSVRIPGLADAIGSTYAPKMHTSSIPKQLVEHLHPLLPDGVEVKIPGAYGGMFGIYGADGWWGDVGIDFDDSWAGEELASHLEMYLDSIQDTLVHVVNRSWPDLGVGGLPSPFVRVAEAEIAFGFDSVECSPITLTS